MLFNLLFIGDSLVQRHKSATHEIDTCQQELESLKAEAEGYSILFAARNEEFLVLYHCGN
jgi:hypothetical protein